LVHHPPVHHLPVLSSPSRPQIAVGSAELLSVQGVVFPALRKVKLIPEDAESRHLSYSRCGRTDKGVSALGQVSLHAQLALAAEPAATLSLTVNNRFFLMSQIMLMCWSDVPCCD